MNQIIEKFLPIIKKQYPDIRAEDIHFFDNGKDHYVLVVNETEAYRFPRGEGFGKKDTIENKFFHDFAKVSPIKIQEMEEQTDDQTRIVYQTYSFIKGVGFTKELARTFKKEELTNIASKLGQFLKQLHSYPLEKAHQISMDSINSAGDYLAFFEGRLEVLKENIFPHLPEEAKHWIENLFKVYLSTSNELFNPRVTHFDMQPVHIIVNPDSHTLAGVIDFSLRIADPARDFMYFNRYGADFVQEAYKSYGEKDKHFDDRRQFYAGELEIIALEDALESKNEIVINKAKENLLNYIKEFPIL